MRMDAARRWDKRAINQTVPVAQAPPGVGRQKVGCSVVTKR